MQHARQFFVGIGPADRFQEMLGQLDQLVPGRRNSVKRIRMAGSSTDQPKWLSADAQTAAALTRAGLLAGAAEEEIRAAAAERFPDYGALDICVSVYRRELQKKGLLE